MRATPIQIKSANQSGTVTLSAETRPNHAMELTASGVYNRFMIVRSFHPAATCPLARRSSSYFR